MKVKRFVQQPDKVSGQRTGAEFRRVQHSSSELEGGTQLGSGGRGGCEGLEGCWGVGLLATVLSGTEWVLPLGAITGLCGHGCVVGAAIVLKQQNKRT